jgi:hypothetical protein
MAIYRFKISFEDYDDVVREIDIKSNQNFEDLHRAIHASTGYPTEVSSSFYVSNDAWIKAEEIAFMPTERKVERGVKLMAQAKLNSFIEDPHQKFYYTYNFDRPFDFHVELVKIILEAEEGKTYPLLVKSIGNAPKIPGSTPVTTSAASAKSSALKDFDFMDDVEFDPANLEDVAALGDMSIETEGKSKSLEAEEFTEAEEEEEDEFMDEFSDNDNYDAEDYQRDDY